MRNRDIRLTNTYSSSADVILFKGDTRNLLITIPENSIQLIVTSPPYNIGKEYEKKKDIEKYVIEQKEIIDLCIPLLTASGSVCWQVGNYISTDSELIPLDIILYDIFKANGLKLRNRIIWHFGHGLHTKRRFSGRYETILWFTQDTDDYYFDLDSIRIPQIYPGKRHFKGPNIGKYSGHPSGKNPTDFWDFDCDVWDIPNVKANHIEKTEHPCQYPIGLVQRLIKALSKKGDWVLDPFLGTGSTACAAILEDRKSIGAELLQKYQVLSENRIRSAWNGSLKTRPYDKPVYIPKWGSKLTQRTD